MIDQTVKSAIEELIHSYVHCIDDNQLEAWPEFFTEDCIYKVTSRDNYLRGFEVCVIDCDSKGMLRDRITAHRQANIYSPHFYRHLVSSIVVKEQAGDAYVVETNYAVFQTKLDGDTHVYNVGKYLDKVVFVDGQPKFKEKLCIYDTLRVPTLMATPI